MAELARLNEAYEAKFPGLRFVVFVNGRGRGEIMTIMRERIERGEWEAERDGAIEVSGYHVLVASCLFFHDASPNRFFFFLLLLTGFLLNGLTCLHFNLGHVRNRHRQSGKTGRRLRDE